VAREILAELAEQYPERSVEVKLEPHLVVDGDRLLLTVVLENLLSNAWKFSSRTPDARIEFFRRTKDPDVYCVRDYGAGFEMEYVSKLFVSFNRLHKQEEYPGSGIGLATVHRALLRQGGRIWVDSEAGESACFCFEL
jgi:hypothetical protein